MIPSSPASERQSGLAKATERSRSTPAPGSPRVAQAQMLTWVARVSIRERLRGQQGPKCGGSEAASRRLSSPTGLPPTLEQ